MLEFNLSHRQLSTTVFCCWCHLSSSGGIPPTTISKKWQKCGAQVCLQLPLQVQQGIAYRVTVNELG